MPAAPLRQGETTFYGVAGRSLFGRWWAPEAPKGLIVLAHGLGEHSGRYDHVGRHLAAAGYAVWALDHRGHGRSEGPRVFVDRFVDYEADLETFRLLAVASHPRLPSVLLGHSMGGAIAVGHAIDYPNRFDALVLTGPALQPGRSVSGALVAAGKVLSRVVPRAGVIGLDSRTVSRDPAVVSAYQSDPLVNHGKVTARLGAELLARAERFEAEAAAITQPVLIIHGTADRLVPIESSRAMVGRFGSDDVTLVEEEGLFHEVLNEPEQQRVLDTITAWIGERLDAPSASGSTSGAAAR